mmetsp:Transcript_24809/g.58207  ORF Transcript_24809/g.58207 Transcript_24809/m.58207 type:complete len:345 (+) Transcript_24809:280-1314(+)
MKIDHRFLVLHVAKNGRSGLPTPALRFGTGGFSELFAKFRVFQLSKARNVSINVTGLHEEAVLFVGDDARNSTGVGGNHRNAAGHALQDDETEGFGITRHDEGIRARKGLRQFVSGSLTEKDGFGALEVFFQFFFLWTLAHHGESGVGHFLKDVTNMHYVFFGAQSSHVYHQEVVGISVRHDFSHLGVFESRIETVGIDPFAPNVDAWDAIINEFLLYLGRRHERQVGSSMGEPQELPSQLLDSGDESEIVDRVRWKVRVIAHDQRDTHRACVENCCQDHESWTRDVDQIGLESIHDPRALHLGKIQCQGNLVVQGKGKSLSVMDFKSEGFLWKVLRGCLSVNR